MTTIPAVQCIQCKKLLPENGKYIIINVEIKEHPNVKAPKQGPPEMVTAKDSVICSNTCLENFVTLGGF